MSSISLKATDGDEYVRELPTATIKHASYIKGLVDAAPDSVVEIDVPHANKEIVDFMVDFLVQHQDDEEIEENWEKLKPREMTDWDKQRITGNFVGMALINLMKATNFIGCQLALNVVATHVGQVPVCP